MPWPVGGSPIRARVKDDAAEIARARGWLERLGLTQGHSPGTGVHPRQVAGLVRVDVSDAGDVTLVRTIADNNDANNNGIGDGLNATANLNAAAISSVSDRGSFWAFASFGQVATTALISRMI